MLILCSGLISAQGLIPPSSGGNYTTYQNLSYYNITNNFIGGNATFNQSLTDGLYIFQSDEGNLNVNSSDYWDNMDTINSTQMEDNDGVLNILESWFSNFFDTLFSVKTTDDLTEGSTNLYDNQTWNQTLGDSLYETIGSGGNLSWNETYANTLYADIKWGYNQTYSGSTYNATYDANSGNASWNETYANTLYAPIGSVGNATFNQSLTDDLYTSKSANCPINESGYTHCYVGNSIEVSWVIS